MAGEALAMLDIQAATSRTRCAYDHRIRNQVVKTGTRCLPKHIRIPRSTVSTWRRRGSRPVVTIEQPDQDRQQLLDTITRLERQKRVLAADVRILLSLLRAFGISLAEVFASATTWAKLVRKRGWLRPRLRVYPAKPTVGVRTTAPNEL